MQARTGCGFVRVHQVLALAEAVQKYGHRTDIQSVRAQPQQVIQQTGDFIEHYADILSTQRHLYTSQLFDRQHIGVLVAHHRDVIQPVHVGQGLQERLVLGEFLGGTMQQSNVRIGTLDDLAIQFQNQTQHAMGCRMLRPKIHGVVFNFRHSFAYLNTCCNARSPCISVQTNLRKKVKPAGRSQLKFMV